MKIDLASQFESAADAVINGNEQALAQLLNETPSLVTARSTLVTEKQPAVHGATLLHYTAANGVEDHRQKTPPNAVAIASMLLEAGAEPDALAHMYGAEATTLEMLVSSTPPARAGVQVQLVETLLNYGAAVDGPGSDPAKTPLLIALGSGFPDAAEALARRGADVNTLPAAAGLGHLSDAVRFLPHASALERHRALALAAQLGHPEIVQLLLDAGEDPNRYNPVRNHGHSTPLHQAVASGKRDVAKLLIQNGARLDIKDKVYQGTPLDWAEHLGRTDMAAYLRSVQKA